MTLATYPVDLPHVVIGCRVSDIRVNHRRRSQRNKKGIVWKAILLMLGRTCAIMWAAPGSMKSRARGRCQSAQAQCNINQAPTMVQTVVSPDCCTTQRPCGSCSLSLGGEQGVTSAYLTGKHDPLCPAPVYSWFLHGIDRVGSPAGELQHCVQHPKYGG